MDAETIREALEWLAGEGTGVSAPDGVKWYVERREPENERERSEEEHIGEGYILYAYADDRTPNPQRSVWTKRIEKSDPEYAIVSLIVAAYENYEVSQSEQAFERSLQQ